MINDTRQAEMLIAHALPDLTSNALIVAGVAVMMFRINPRLALFTMIPVPFVVVISRLFSKKVTPLFRINQRVLGEVNGMTQDNLSGMKEIQSFAQEAQEHGKMAVKMKEYSQVNINANYASALYHPSIEFFTSLGTVVVVAFGGWMAGQGTMPVADVVGFIMYLSLFFQPLAVLARLAEDVQHSYASAIRVFDILDAETDVPEAPDAAVLAACEGEVTFENVTFHYNEQEPVLRDVSFNAKPGEMLAIVGPTGVGKTTVLSLLERFYDPIKGAVRLDGHNIASLTLKSLRDQISMVLQDTFLFNATIADNIAYGRPGAAMDEIIAAARAANAEEFIGAMPSGYMTMVGERGVRLSGGQKQRIAIARAILRGTPILVLDEATSSVDTETESEIQIAIDRLAGSRTILVIAHRLSTVMRADQILVMKEGSIVERGTHGELVGAGGMYARMYRLQQEGRRLSRDADLILFDENAEPVEPAKPAPA
jgi:ABC-type multidrug transport system fused ATPase/permease subunit